MADVTERPPQGNRSEPGHEDHGQEHEAHKHGRPADSSHGGIDLDPDTDPADGEEATVEDNPIWQQENVTLRSVGIDIGSSGTQVVLSLLRLRRDGAGLATRYVVVDRLCLFQSEVSFTPFSRDGTIDAERLGAVIDRAYGDARVTPADIDTGVVILTGEALRRTNAERIAEVVALTAGDFVCAAAGHHMEATLAAHGSGAVQRSADTGRTILNIDIGGGTTKLALVSKGTITATAALHVGGRLLATDHAGRIVRLEPAAMDLASQAGFELHIGDLVTPDALDATATHMADIVARAVRGDQPASGSDLPYLTEPIADLSEVDAVLFSGGVGEYVYGAETRDFGDLGRRFGQALADRLASGNIPYPLESAAERIRATALGASEFCVQLSGTTCFIPDPLSLLPRRNLPVVRPRYTLDADIDIDALAATVSRHIDMATVPGLDHDVVLALSWSGELSHHRLHCFAVAVARGLTDRIAEGRPVILAVEADIGRSLGTILRDELDIQTDVMVIDGLRLQDFDYIDLGLPVKPSGVVPATIKSLVFATPHDPPGP